MAIGSRLRGILDELIATGYPDEVAERIASGDLPMDTASRMQRAREQGYSDDVFYKGMYPYDYTKESEGYLGPVISEINRQSPFPSFGGSDGDIDIAGFMSKDPDVASRFAGPNIARRGAIFPLRTKNNAVGVIDAKGKNAGDVQFGESGRPFRDMVRSGEYDSVVIKNTADEGDVYIALKPSNIRSQFAAFDPEYTGSNILGFQGESQSPSLLGVTAQSAVGAASLVAPETPESELYEGLTDKMVDYLAEQMGGSEEDRERAEYISMGMDFLPFIGAAKGVSETFDAYKNDDTLGMALGAGGILAGLFPFGRGAYKGVLGIAEDAPVVTRDTGLLQRVGDPESVNTMRLDVEPGVELAPNRLLSAEDLEGRGFVSGMADTSRGDLSRVVSVNDQPVNMVRFGGQDYMRQPQNVDRGILWASDAGAVTGLTNAAKAARALPGVNRSPVYIPYQMGGASTDFATMTSDIMVPIARQNMKKADKKALDKRIREGAGTKKGEFKPQPDWPGIDSPKTDEWLASAGGNRKAVTKAIDEYRDVAGINLSQARAAIVDPAQINPRVGNLRQAGILDLTRPPQPGMHPSYNTDLMGTYLGEFGEGASLLSDLNPLIRGADNKPFVPEMISRGHNLQADALPAPVGKAMQAGLIGAFDQATLDELIKKGLIAP